MGGDGEWELSVERDGGPSGSEASEFAGEPVGTNNFGAFLNSLFLRLLFVAGLAFAASFFVAQLVAPLVLPASMSDATNKIASSMADARPADISAAAVAQGACWVYLTDAHGTPTASFAPLVPKSVKLGHNSQPIVIANTTFYDATAQTPNGTLHVGWLLVPPLEFLTNRQGSVPVGFVLLWIVLGAGMLVAIASLTVLSATSKLHSRAGKLLSMSVEERAGLLEASGVPHEIELAYLAIKTICGRYDHERFERLTREHDLKKQRKALEEEKNQLESTLQAQMYESHRSISELSFRESEESLLKLLDSELATTSSSSHLPQRAMDRLNEKYPSSIRQVAFFACQDHGRMRLGSHLGMSDATLKALKGWSIDDLSHYILKKGAAVLLNETEMAEVGFGLDTIGRAEGWKAVYLAPVTFGTRDLGLMMVCFDEQSKNTMHDRRRILQSVIQLLSREMHKMVALEEELAAGRTDSLTGLYNKKFFHDNVPKILSRAKTLGHHVSMLMVDGDHFKDINDAYGHDAGDQILKELATLMRAGVRSEESEANGRFKDYVLRWGGEEFLIILDNTEQATAMMVAERLRKTVADKKNWPAGVPNWSVSIGLSAFPNDGDEPDTIVKAADVALYYCKKQLGRNCVTTYEDVPKAFRSQMGGALEGRLGVFDPVAIMQSLLTAQKSGVLTVTNKNRHFWMLLHQGRPLQARLGTIPGNAAIVEFVTTFDEGKFAFQEKPGTNEPKKMLDDTCDVTRSLERCLMDAALAQDNLDWARTVIKDAHRSALVLVEPEQLPSAKEAMIADTATVTPEDIELVDRMMAKLEYGSAGLKDLTKAFEHMPSAYIWRGAALMLRYGLVYEKVLDQVTAMV